MSSSLRTTRRSSAPHSASPTAAAIVTRDKTQTAKPLLVHPRVCAESASLPKPRQQENDRSPAKTMTPQTYTHPRRVPYSPTLRQVCIPAYTEGISFLVPRPSIVLPPPTFVHTPMPPTSEEWGNRIPPGPSCYLHTLIGLCISKHATRNKHTMYCAKRQESLVPFVLFCAPHPAR